MAKTTLRHINTGPQLGIGIGAGLLAWACCISAVVLGFLGLGSAAAFMSDVQTNYHWYLVGFAFLCMDGAIYYLLKQYHGKCDLRIIRHNTMPIVFILMVALFVYLILNAILPYLGELSMPSGHMMM